MKTKDVNLPKLRRMPESQGGHVLYPPGADSICPYHRWCAYTGDEPNRCPECHRSREIGCIHVGEGGLPPGRKSPCYHPFCGELFTSLTAFDKHLRPVDDDRVCRDPAKRGLVLAEQNGWFLWGNPGTRPPRGDN